MVIWRNYYDCNNEVRWYIIWHTLRYFNPHFLEYGNLWRNVAHAILDCSLRFNYWILGMVILLIILGLFGLELLSIIITLCIRKWGVYGKGWYYCFRKGVIKSKSGLSWNCSSITLGSLLGSMCDWLYKWNVDLKKIPMLVVVLTMVGCTTYDIKIQNTTVFPVVSETMVVRDMQNPYRK